MTGAPASRSGHPAEPEPVVSALSGERPSRFGNVAVPFVLNGNQRGLTVKQLFEDDELRAFILRFPQSFEFDAERCVWNFIEPEMGR